MPNMATTALMRLSLKKFIPYWLMNWLSRYLDGRINKLKQQSIKMTWQNMYLQKAVDDIQSRQRGK